MTAYVKNASVPPHLVDHRDPPAIALLKEDHQIFRALFDLIETIGEEILFPIAGEICVRLAIHMNLEEEFLYPSLKSLLDPGRIDDSVLDHQLAKRLISKIMDMTGREASFRARVQGLGEEVIRHADEEDRELLRDARRAWEDGKVDLVAIGIEMQSRRRDLLALVGSAAAETWAFDVELPADAVEYVAQRPTVDGEAWPEPAGAVGHGRH
jgi:hypothetical protein